MKHAKEKKREERRAHPEPYHNTKNYRLQRHPMQRMYGDLEGTFMYVCDAVPTATGWKMCTNPNLTWAPLALCDSVSSAKTSIGTHTPIPHRQQRVIEPGTCMDLDKVAGIARRVSLPLPN